MKSSTALSQSEREASILNQLPQVKLLAKRLHRRCPPNILLEDLESAGITGLVQSADRYDCTRGVKFKTIAEHRIRGAMLDYLRSLDPLPRGVPRWTPENRPYVDTSKAANGAEPEQDYLYPAGVVSANIFSTMDRDGFILT